MNEAEYQSAPRDDHAEAADAVVKQQAQQPAWRAAGIAVGPGMDIEKTA